MNRRNFLLGSAGLIGAEPLAGRTADAEPSADDLKLGVATYSFREFQSDLCIKYVKALNIEYVDVKEFHLPQTDPPDALAAGTESLRQGGPEGDRGR